MLNVADYSITEKNKNMKLIIKKLFGCKSDNTEGIGGLVD